MRRSRGLRAQLMLLVLLAMIPLLGVIVYYALKEHEQEARRVEHDAMMLTQLITREQNQLNVTTRQLLVNVAKLPVVQDPKSGAACNWTLAETLKAYSAYNNIAVAGADGRLYCSAKFLSNTNINIADRSYFRRAFESRDFSVGDYQIGRITGKPTIGFGYPVVVNGEVRGIVVAGLDLEWTDRLMADIHLQPESIVMAIDSNGTVVAHYPDFSKWIGRSFPSAQIVKDILAQRVGTTTGIGLDGVPRLFAHNILLEGTNGSIHVAVGIPTATAYAEVNGDLIQNLILLGFAAALALIAAWFVSDILVLRRINILADAAQRLGRGDLTARTGLPHGDEEMGQLARSFDEMAATLQRVNRALKTLGAGNRALVRATDEQTLLADMCRAIVDVGGYRFVWIGFMEYDEQRTIRPVAQAGLPGDLDAFSKMIGPISWDNYTEEGRTPASHVARSGRPYVAKDVHAERVNATWRQFEIQHRLTASATFPLVVNEKVVGVLSIYSQDPQAFNAEEQELLEEAVHDLAFGISVLRGRAESERAKATIERMAYFDRLTGLPNHAQFEKQLRQELAQAKEKDQQLALVVLDVNRLREINDALGFHQGDLLLKDVGARIRELVPQDMMVSRMRGDEFSVLIPGSNAERAIAVVRQIMDSLREPFAVGSLNLDVDATAGISIYPQHGMDVVQLLRHADVAMQQAKKMSKDYVFYSSEQDIDSAQRLALAGELRYAIKSNELVLYYQPKIDLKNGRVCGAEALVRWIHPKRGMVRPDEFISLAESTGLIKPLTDWVMEAAMRQISAWRGAGIVLPVAVNLSTRNLLDVELQDKAERLFAAHHAHADWLELEITEGAMMADPEGALKILTRLSDMGIKLFIDDFGTGYSSLGYLKKLPVDAIKIDKSFVMDMIASHDSAAIVRSTIDLAHDLNLKVVAEGVESKAMLDQLITLGCDTAQGYYFTKPLPADQFLQWCKRHASGLVSNKQIS